MKLFCIFLIFGTLLFAEEAVLDDLLSQYREASELSHDTKRDMSGHITVFSRSDLNKMQAYTLNDVLKTIKMFTLKNTIFGPSALVKSPYSENTMSAVKLYINNHEVTSITAGTGIAQFGMLGLNHIDHIEVYQASNAIAFHGEPGNMVIKLYTKDASRENATVAQGSLDTKGGSRGQVIDAQNFGDYSYLANADIGANNYDKEYGKNNKELSRDTAQGQFYGSFSKKNDYTIEGSISKNKSDIFSGLAQASDGGSITTNYSYIQLTKALPLQIELLASGIYEEAHIDNKDALGIPLFDALPTNHLDVKTGSYNYDTVLQKRSNYDNHHFLFGTEAKLKSFFLDSIKSNGVQKEYPLGSKQLGIYMLFAEDSYDINENHQLIFGAKTGYYDDRQNNTETLNTLRFAYLAKLSEDFSLKSFIQNGYVYPIFAQTTFSPVALPNPQLRASKTEIFKLETEYKNNGLRVTLGTGASHAKDGIIFDKISKMYINNKMHSDFSQFFITSEYRFNTENKLLVEWFKAYKDNYSFTSDTGGLIQLYSTFGKLDLYNELVYRSSYIGTDGVHLDEGYDYTAGVIYHYSKHLDVKLKGENIFDKAIETSISGTKIPVFEPRAVLTLEYLF